MAGTSNWRHVLKELQILVKDLGTFRFPATSNSKVVNLTAKELALYPCKPYVMPGKNSGKSWQHAMVTKIATIFFASLGLGLIFTTFWLSKPSRSS